MHKLTNKMSEMSISSKKSKRHTRESSRKVQRTHDRNGRRGNGVAPPNLNRNMWSTIMTFSKTPVLPFSKTSLLAHADDSVARTNRYSKYLQPQYREAIDKFPSRPFVATNLTDDQKRRVREALTHLMYHRNLGRFKMPFKMRGVLIKQHYPEQQRSVGRFNIYVNGIRLTEPVSRRGAVGSPNGGFYAPPMTVRLRNHRAPHGIGHNMNRAGWSRLMFEPYN